MLPKTSLVGDTISSTTWLYNHLKTGPKIIAQMIEAWVEFNNGNPTASGPLIDALNAARNELKVMPFIARDNAGNERFWWKLPSAEGEDESVVIDEGPRLRMVGK